MDAFELFSPLTPLIVHDGELADVCQLLAELGLDFAEAPATNATAYYDAQLVIASPPYLLERLQDAGQEHPERIAIMTSEARTVRSILSRSGVNRVVRRPVHPTALRLFILHCLYRGHDKRKHQRVSIGAEIKVRRGWRRRKVLLAEISQRDCRLVTRHSFSIDQVISLQLPRRVTGRAPLPLLGRIVRIGAADAETGLRELGLIFEHPGPRIASLLADVIELHAMGPAIYPGSLPKGSLPTGSLPAPASHAPATKHAAPDAGGRCDGVLDPAASSSEPIAASEANRRAFPRHSFERRVIALGAEAARVLIGRDISLRGMRVEASHAIALGDRLQLAVHAPGQKTPLVLHAEVKRDDGERGLLLEFDEVSPELEQRLHQTLESLRVPSKAPGEPHTALPDPFVSEIVEHSALAG